MTKRKFQEEKLPPSKKRLIDIIYSEFDSDPDSEDDPEWLPDSDDSGFSSAASEMDSDSYSSSDSDSESKSDS